MMWAGHPLRGSWVDRRAREGTDALFNEGNYHAMLPVQCKFKMGKRKFKFLCEFYELLYFGSQWKSIF